LPTHVKRKGKAACPPFGENVRQLAQRARCWPEESKGLNGWRLADTAIDTCRWDSKNAVHHTLKNWERLVEEKIRTVEWSVIDVLLQER